MKEITEFLKANANGILSTVDGDKPRARPFQFQFEREGAFYFCTANTKDVYKQLRKNPHVEFCSQSPKFTWVRLEGKAVFADDLKLKEAVLSANPLVKSLYKTADNPAFALFRLEHGKAVMADFSGQPPKRFEF
jgi:uncharacterized pyridoxamine 5'-phosphate oxidase family protein